MNRKNIAFGLATVVLSNVAIATEAQAARITGLYGTGVDNNGVARLDNGTLPELHYSLTSSPNGVTGARVYRHPAWSGGGTSSTSAWIAPIDGSGPPGLYTYTTTFDLTGLSARTAQISGNWAADDGRVSILLNGQSTGINYTTSNNGYTYAFYAYTPFTINSTANFLPGINTLSFTINNLPPGGPNTTGLRVELSGTANIATSVPEPFTIVGTIIGGTAALRLRKKLKSETIDRS